MKFVADVIDILEINFENFHHGRDDCNENNIWICLLSQRFA